MQPPRQEVERARKAQVGKESMKSNPQGLLDLLEGEGEREKGREERKRQTGRKKYRRKRGREKEEAWRIEYVKGEEGEQFGDIEGGSIGLEHILAGG